MAGSAAVASSCAVRRNKSCACDSASANSTNERVSLPKWTSSSLTTSGRSRAARSSTRRSSECSADIGSTSRSATVARAHRDEVGERAALVLVGDSVHEQRLFHALARAGPVETAHAEVVTGELDERLAAARSALVRRRQRVRRADLVRATLEPLGEPRLSEARRTGEEDGFGAMSPTRRREQRLPERDRARARDRRAESRGFRRGRARHRADARATSRSSRRQVAGSGGGGWLAGSNVGRANGSLFGRVARVSTTSEPARLADANVRSGKGSMAPRASIVGSRLGRLRRRTCDVHRGFARSRVGCDRVHRTRAARVFDRSPERARARAPHRRRSGSAGEDSSRASRWTHAREAVGHREPRHERRRRVLAVRAPRAPRRPCPRTAAARDEVVREARRASRGRSTARSRASRRGTAPAPCTTACPPRAAELASVASAWTSPKSQSFGAGLANRRRPHPEHVRGLEVAMDDAVRVRVRERVEQRARARRGRRSHANGGRPLASVASASSIVR